MVYQFKAPAAVHPGKFWEFSTFICLFASCAYGRFSFKL